MKVALRWLFGGGGVVNKKFPGVELALHCSPVNVDGLG